MWWKQAIVRVGVVRSCSRLPQCLSYSRFAPRRPSKIILPIENSGLKKETIVELDRSGKPRPSPPPPATSHRKSLETETAPPYFQDIPTSDKDRSVADAKATAKTNQNKYDRKKRVGFDSLGGTQIIGTEKDNLFDSDGNLIYTKLQDNDSKIGVLMVSLKSKKDRGRCGYFMVEGWRMIVDGLRAKSVLRTVIFSDKSQLDKIELLLPQNGVRLLKIPYREIQMWSTLETSPGVIGIFETPKPSKELVSLETLPINIICDNIREPGNLGSILRMADGAGCRNVLLTTGCVDLWEPKVLRSAAGAHFRLHVHHDLKWNDIVDLVPEKNKIFLADNKFATRDEGLTQKSNNQFTFKDRIRSNLSLVDDTKNDIDKYSIPILSYYDVDFSRLHSVCLIIGGETEGISEECYRFTAMKGGTRINIPLKSGVESLNSGMALAVIIFEIKRQLMKAVTNSDSEDENSLKIRAV